MEGGTTEGRGRVSTYERVDPLAIGIGAIGPNGFSNQHATFNAVEIFSLQAHGAAMVEQSDIGLICYPVMSSIIGMD